MLLAVRQVFSNKVQIDHKTKTNCKERDSEGLKQYDVAVGRSKWIERRYSRRGYLAFMR